MNLNCSNYPNGHEIYPKNIYGLLKGIGRLFYLVDREETTFENFNEVPNYYSNAWPYFLLLIILENIVLKLQHKRTYRVNDGITSVSHGIIQECGKILSRGTESYCYLLIYNNYRILELPWKEPMTWYLAALGIDFCFYWAHRISHEVHIFWAQHQVHHSSEEFNLTVGLRQSFVQMWCSSIAYLPLAFVLPPSHYIAHQHLNLLYQFWIHSGTVSHLGPLEYIFNTPNHHRVHHGSNIYCLDKNYGGVLIIWDRIFGTFAAERKEEPIIYGLVVNQPSFNPLHLQTFYTSYALSKYNRMEGWKLKFCALFFGPSWRPGGPRLGLDEEKIKVTSRIKYDVKLPVWCNIYLVLHFLTVCYVYHQVALSYMSMNPLIALIFVVYILASLTSIGMLFDGNQKASMLEFIRCLMALAVIYFMNFKLNAIIIFLLQATFVLSSLFWFLNYQNVLQFTSRKIKSQ